MATVQRHRQPFPPLVGREDEQRLLDASLHEVLAGRGQLMLLAGEPGIGKTRLAEEAARETVARGVHALWGHCFEWAGTPAYWPWIEILRELVESSEPEQLRGQLGQHASLLAQVVPEIREILTELPVVPEMNPEQARFRLFDGITRYLKKVASDAPLLLVLDDLHWADPGSLLLLDFVARDLVNTPILMIGTYRDDEVRRDHPLASTLASLIRVRTTERLSLARLERDHIAEMVREMAGVEPTEQAVEDVYAETEGNPFFATEVIRLLVTQQYFDHPPTTGDRNVTVPEGVREVIGRRLHRLSSQCNEMLNIASVIGREFSLPILEQVCERARDDILVALDEAIEARVIEERGQVGQYQFTHTLIQETLYADLWSSWRLRLHSKVAEASEREHNRDLSAHYGDLARHFRLSAIGENQQKAIDYAVKAGDQAMEQVAWESAAGHYQRAAELLETDGNADVERLCWTLLKLGKAQERAAVSRGHASGAGNDPTTRQTHKRVAMLARDAGLTELFAWAALGATGGSLHNTTHDSEQVSLQQEALQALPEEDSEIRARLLARLGRDFHHWSMCDARLIAQNDLSNELLSERATSLGNAAVAMARRLDERHTLVYALLARPQLRTIPLTSCLHDQLKLTGEAITIARETSDHILEAWGVIDQCRLLIESGEVQRARHCYEQLARITEPLKMPILDWFRCILQVAEAINTGRYEEAERIIEQGHQIWPNSVTLHCQALMLRREREQPSGELGEFVRRNFSLNDPTWPGFFPFLLVSLLQEEGDIKLRAAAKELDLNVLLALPRTSTWIRSITLYAEIGIQLRELDWSRRLYDALLPFEGLNIGGGFHDHTGGSVAYYLGLLATTLERWDEAEEHFAVALERNEQWGYRPYVAYTKYGWADMLLRRNEPGDRERAVEMVAEAKPVARKIGMVRLLRLIDELEQRERLRSPREKTNTSGLSPREHEVLRLLVDGKSDREIGEELFISPRTAMQHVSNILRKLDVESRGAAAVYAVRNDLV